MAGTMNDLPWKLLTENLEGRTDSVCTNYSTNYHFRFKSDQNESLQSLVDAMVRAIEESADLERSKYQDTYAIPSPEDVVIDDNVAQRITPLIHRWRNDSPYWKCEESASRIPCRHRDESYCKCVLPFEERKMSAFLREFTTEPDPGVSAKEAQCPYDVETNKRVLFNLEVFKTLIICGEMETILRICSHPDARLYYWWEYQFCRCRCPGGCNGWSLNRPGPNEHNWRLIAMKSLASLITLNSMSCLTQASTSTSPQLGHGTYDYRCTEAYQEMVFDGTRVMSFPLVQYQHRLFFGIVDGQFHDQGGVRDGSELDHVLCGKGIRMWTSRPPLGYVPTEHFLDCQGGKVPDETLHTPSDIFKVRSDLLKQTRLPAELVDIILTQGEYDNPRRILPISNDPLHPGNHQQLQEYLNECWALLTRCEIVIRTLNASRCRAAESGRALVDAVEENHGNPVSAMKADWQSKIQHVMSGFFACACCAEMLKEGKDLGFISEGDLGPNAIEARCESIRLENSRRSEFLFDSDSC